MSSTYSDPRLFHFYKVFRCRQYIPHANPHVVSKVEHLGDRRPHGTPQAGH